MARIACTISVWLLPLCSAVALAQPAALMPNAVAPAMQSPAYGPPQMYPDRNGWANPAEPFRAPTWPPAQPGPGATTQLPPAAPQQQPWPAFEDPSPPAANEFEPAQTVARVGDQYVFRGDLEGDANLVLAPILDQLPPDEIEQNRSDIQAQREELVRRLLPSVVDRKLMYLEFLRTIPPAQFEKVQENIQTKVSAAFEESVFEMLDKLRAAKPEEYQDLARQDGQLYRLALAMMQHDMSSLAQLDIYLRRYGSSLEKQTQAFAERQLGQQALRSQIKVNPEVTHQEMLEHYRANIQEFQVPAQARWQQITVRFDRFRSREEAGQAIAALGNEVYLGGAPFWAVAQRSSHGRNAAGGGFHDWTDWGDLEVSREIQKAAFSEPIGKLSGIVKDVEGLHIIRVLERRDAHVVPFTEAQIAIKKQIEQRKRNEALAKFVKELHERTPIWTIYDGEQGAERLAEPGHNDGGSVPR